VYDHQLVMRDDRNLRYRQRKKGNEGKDEGQLDG
jgi:hypothetical protein